MGGRRATLVTGATGLLGGMLAAELARAGHHVVCTSRTAHARSGDGEHQDRAATQWLQLDLGGPCRFPQLDCLFHCAPIWCLPAHIEDLAHAGVGRIIAFSSTSAQTKAGSSDGRERQLARALRDAEQAAMEKAQANSVQITVFRPTMIYGYGKDRNVSTIARFIKRYRMFFLAGEARGLRQPVHVSDLVSACVAALDKSGTHAKRYDLPGGESLTYRQMVARVFTGLGVPQRMISLPLPLYRICLRMIAGLSPGSGYSMSMADRMNQDLVFDDHEARRDFGFAPQRFLLDPQRDLAGIMS